MIKRHILSSVGVIGIASGLAATPALASEDNSETEDISLEARGDFAGFRIQQRSIDIDAPIAVLPEFRISETTFEGTVTPPSPELIVRDDVGVDFGDPDNLAPYAVHIFQQRNADGGVFFNCSGSVINPRTILTAAHCLNGSDGPIATTSSESYGLPESGAATTLLIATGQSSAPRLFTYIGDGSGYAEGGVARSTDVVIHPTGNPDNTGLGFPWADIALISVDSPITDVPSLPILLTPLTELTHVLQVGYGTNGTGLTGGTNAGSSFLRRVGENTLGLLGSTGDYIDGVFPALAPSTQVLGFESQVYYWTDFDNPDRTPEQQAGCAFPGDTISCTSLEAVFAIDYFDGDALPLEAGTAPGDSGSPLVADQLAEFPLAIGVLSGGFDFFGLGSAYSDVSFYNPLFPFFEFITENTSYKYVSANEGDGVWSDASRWTQDLDPGFFIQDADGNLVNGIPDGNEPGIFASGPKLGTVLGNDISGNSTAITPGFEGIDTTLPESSVLLGPGSTGFVPQNTDGTPGIAFANPAQYFEVHLNRAGTTTVDLDVEIDQLVIDNSDAAFVLSEPYEFTSIIGVEQFAGNAAIDGTLNAGLYALLGGGLTGNGTINTDVLFNIGGFVSPGDLGSIGTLTVNGNYVQTSGAGLVADIFKRNGRTVESDLLAVNGLAVLDGTLVLVNQRGTPRFGSTFTVLTADEVDGAFADTLLIVNNPTLTAESRVEDGNVIVEIGARRIGRMVGRGSGLQSLGNALDTLRFSGRFAEYAAIFDVIDSASFENFGASLSSLTPVNAFNQQTIANGFSQRFTGQIAQRTLALRGANGAAAGFSSAGNAGFAMGGTAPRKDGQMGFFGTVSGSFLNTNTVDRSTGINAFEEAAFTQAGELTVGADLRVSEGLSLGVAMTNIRNSQTSSGALRPRDDQSRSAAVYAAYQAGNGFADMYFGFSDQEYGTQRASLGDFQSSYSTAIGQTDGEQSFAGLRLGYAVPVAKGFEIGPVVSMDYVRNELGAYSEFGAGQLGLNIQGRTFNSLGAKMGVMSSLDLNVGRTGKITAFGSVAYSRELADTSDVVTASFFGAPDAAFQISNQLDPEWVSINAGAEMQVADNIKAGISVTSDLGRGVLTNNQGRASLTWKF